MNVEGGTTYREELNLEEISSDTIEEINLLPKEVEHLLKNGSVIFVMPN
jgi:hypothetical protein